MVAKVMSVQVSDDGVTIIQVLKRNLRISGIRLLKTFTGWHALKKSRINVVGLVYLGITTFIAQTESC